ncbi:hypothetical protein [Sulfurospirillum sp. 1612]|uniref:hypothetical protein n=1 Tax=Sulfurospirillum sp. 1612 TaxID=3094835 RepID=UPI002F94AF57
MTVNLMAERGRKTWIGKVMDPSLKLNFMNGHWGKERGVLEFNIQETGYYISQAYKRAYFEIYRDENGVLQRKECTKQDILKTFLLEELVQLQQERNFSMNIIKPAPRNTVWEFYYEPIENEKCYFSENDDYYMITGKFKQKGTKYMRNLTKTAIVKEKEIELKNEIYSKEKDNIKIVFYDEDRIDITKPVSITKNSILVPGPLGFVGISQ